MKTTFNFIVDCLGYEFQNPKDSYFWLCTETTREYFDIPPGTRSIDVIVSNRPMAHSYKVRIIKETPCGDNFEFMEIGDVVYLPMEAKKRAKKLFGGKHFYVRIEY